MDNDTLNNSVSDTASGSLHDQTYVKKRSLAVSIIFSFLCPGLGHIYCGEAKRGIIVFLVVTLIPAILYTVTNFTNSIIFLGITILVSLLMIIFLISDTVFVVRKKKIYQLKYYNRWYIYTGIVFIGLLISLIFDLFQPVTYSTPSASMLHTIEIGDRVFVNETKYGIKNPFTNGFLVRFNRPKTGDIINFYSPVPLYGEEVNTRSDLDQQTIWLKRVLGTPGDTLQIVSRMILVNDNIYEKPNTQLFDSYSYNSKNDHLIFPQRKGWNADNYGPIVIPKEGDEIKLDTGNINDWKVFILREGAKEIETHGYQIFIDGIESYTYKVKRNYYFVIGDNWYNSLDSRYIGFISEDSIIGQLSFIYFSLDVNSSSIRWDRIGKKIE